jgi:predicted P-loop ATPase
MAGRLTADKITGFKADMTPVLISAQGKVKSSSIEALNPDPRNFATLDIGESTANKARMLIGKLVIEMAELNGLYKNELDAFKAWASNKHDDWVVKFQEHTAHVARRWVAIGTNNNRQFLRDESGNRRWLPIELIEDQQVDIDKIKADRLQIWAQALHMLDNIGSDKTWFQDAERLAESSGAIGKSQVVNDSVDWVIEECVQSILAGAPKCAAQEDEFQTKDVQSALAQDHAKLSIFRAEHRAGRQDRHIAECLRRLGYVYVTSRRSSERDPAMRWRKV